MAHQPLTLTLLPQTAGPGEGRGAQQRQCPHDAIAKAILAGLGKQKKGCKESWARTEIPLHPLTRWAAGGWFLGGQGAGGSTAVPERAARAQPCWHGGRTGGVCWQGSAALSSAQASWGMSTCPLPLGKSARGFNSTSQPPVRKTAGVFNAEQPGMHP